MANTINTVRVRVAPNGMRGELARVWDEGAALPHFEVSFYDRYGRRRFCYLYSSIKPALQAWRILWHQACN